MAIFEKVDAGVATDSEDDLVVIEAVACCLKATAAILLADGRRAKKPAEEQITFRNENWEQVYSSNGNGWFHANLRINRSSFEYIADFIESAANDLGIDLNPAANARVDYRMKLAMTLAYLAQASGFQATATVFGVAKATAIVSINTMMDIMQAISSKVISVRRWFIFVLHIGFNKYTDAKDTSSMAENCLRFRRKSRLSRSRWRHRWHVDRDRKASGPRRVW
jgi:hypothetical protein